MENKLYKSSLRSEDKIGRGGFSTVFKGHQKNNNQTPVAIKRIENDAHYVTDNAMKDFEAMLAVCGHENIVQLLDLHVQPDFIYIIMEYCNRGDLTRFLSEGVPSDRVKLDIMRQCAAGVSYIHGLSPSVVHRDLKPQNFLLNEAPSGVICVKLCDFGLAKVFSDMTGSIGAKYMSTGGGTMPFMAPEMWMSEPRYTAMVDTYALGLVFAVIVNYSDSDKERLPQTVGVSRELWYGMRQLEAHNEHRPPPSLYLSPQFAEKHPRMKSLIVEMTSFDAKKRTKMQKVESEIDQEISDLKTAGSQADRPTAEFTEKLVPTEKPSTLGNKVPATHSHTCTSQGVKADKPQPEAGARPKQYQQKKSKTSEASPVEAVSVRKQPTVGASPSTVSVGAPASPVSHPVSYRRTDRRLGSIKQITLVKEGSFKIRKQCTRFCYNNNVLYFPCLFNHSIDCYSMEGRYIRSIDLNPHELDSLYSVHPLNRNSLLLAAHRGLYEVGTGEGGKCRCVLRGMCIDLHVSEGVVAILVGRDRVHILQVSDLSSPGCTITLTDSDALTVLLHQDSLWVSSGGEHPHISLYSLSTEELTSQYGRWGKVAAGELGSPRLSACDTEGGLLVADWYNHRLQTLSAGGEWAMLQGLGEVRMPWDAVIAGGCMLILDNIYKVHTYKIIYKSDSEIQDTSQSDSETKDTSKSDSETKDTSKSDSEKKGTSKSNSETKDTRKSNSETKDTSKSYSQTKDTSKSDSEKKDTSKSNSETKDTSKSNSETKDTSKSNSEKKDTSKSHSKMCLIS